MKPSSVKLGVRSGALAVLVLAACVIVRSGTSEKIAVAAAEQPASAIGQPMPLKEDPKTISPATLEQANPRRNSSDKDPSTGEPVPSVIPGITYILCEDGRRLEFFPADPNKLRSAQKHWVIMPHFWSQRASYHPETRILEVWLSSELSLALEARVVEHLQKITGSKDKDFVLTPVRTQKIEVALRVLDKKEVIYSESSDHVLNHGSIPLPFRVTDEAIHQILSKRLNLAQLIVHSIHPYDSFERSEVRIEVGMEVFQKLLEEVLPNGMTLADLARNPLILDRKSFAALKTVLKDTCRITFKGDPAKLTRFEKLIEKFLTRLIPTDVPLDQITDEMLDRVVTLDRKTRKLEIQPDQKKHLTTRLVESKESRKAFKHAWDTLREEARKEGNAETWHNTLLKKIKLDASLSASVKATVAAGKHDAKLNFEKEYNQSDEGTRAASEEAWKKMRNAGEMSEEEAEKTLRDFEGALGDEGTKGKILNLCRVTNMDVTTFREVLFEHVEQTGKGLRSNVTILSLEPSDVRYKDLEHEIVNLEKKQMAEMKTIRAELESQKAASDRLEKKNAEFAASMPRTAAGLWSPSPIDTGWGSLTDPKHPDRGPNRDGYATLISKVIEFPRGKFASPPGVKVWIRQIGIAPGLDNTTRYWLGAESISKDGFQIKLESWYGGAIFHSVIEWEATGP